MQSTQQSAASGNEFLLDFWYVACRSVQIKPGAMRRQILLDRPLLIVRDHGGEVFALDDCCPHRGIPLSDGNFDGAKIECCYHGWQFGCRGECVLIPSLAGNSTVKIERIRVRNYHCRETDGLVWVYVPASRNPSFEELPAVPQLIVFSDKYRLSVLSQKLSCALDHGIIGLMDPAHGAFVHRSWWWRGRGSIHEKAKRFEPIPNGFRMSAHTPSKNSAPYKLLKFYNHPITTQIDFELPNRRTERIRCGDYWFSSQVLVTPITRNECRIDVVAAWNIFSGVPFVAALYRLFARQFIRQDQRIMEKQAIGLRDNPSLLLIEDADTQARWYYELKRARQAAVAKKQTTIKNPLDEPVVLRWRS